MAESIEETERKLTRLSGKIRAGWAKLHPAKQEHRDAVRRALLQQQREAAQNQGKPKQGEAKAAEKQEEEKPRHRHGH